MASEQQQQETGGRSAERVAFNDDIFRKANERIADRASELGMTSDKLPLICECAEESCTTGIKVPPDEYARVRSDPRLFLNAPGHHVAAHGWAEVVERQPGYVIAEKIGRAGEIVEALDE